MSAPEVCFRWLDCDHTDSQCAGKTSDGISPASLFGGIGTTDTDDAERVLQCCTITELVEGSTVQEASLHRHRDRMCPI